MNEGVGVPGSETIQRSNDVLIGALVLMVGFSALTSKDDTLATLTTLLAFSGVYYWGALVLELRAQWRTLIWLLALVGLWVVLLPMQPLAVYLVFPLYFLFLTVMPDFRGVTAVLGATVVAIMNQYPAFTPGGVLGPALAALVTIAIFFAFRRLWLAHVERENLLQELLSTRHQLIATEREAGMVAERQRIAHEIHDTLAQGLSSIQMLLHVAEKDVASAHPDQAILRIQQARATAAENLSEARAMIAALQPAGLAGNSLEAALQRVAASAQNVAAKVVVEGESRALPMRVEATLLRIAQGAMGNVVKHAQAGRAQITLTFAPEEVRLDVVDDGVGFDPAGVDKHAAGLGHIGLEAMRSRVAEVGGVFTVESAPGEGAAVSVAIPLLDCNR
ncbi:sensor histidine kinase [Corynebacterium epidermidicanis]|uniref:Signal transduction histidine kinase n=1 Tax=Corynebacterium epidermidicanis TaxID=1050174 RepID=A0A0G3GSQ9_9CORY|nr:sensor histidine kinase [Corynebacterium epidermidicanis]AKK04191.1 signal transduction histidine kinase [Corynebacterium epidermidicanis]